MWSRSLSYLQVLALLAPAARAGVFSFGCNQKHLVYDRMDPVVDPGMVSGHEHAIVGGDGFGDDMSFQDTQASSCTTCEINEDRSNYWTPSIYYTAKNGSLIPVESNELTFYYSMESTEGEDFEGPYRPFPEDFRMLAGNTNRREDDGSRAAKFITFSCHTDDGIDPHRKPGFPKKKCNTLAAEIHFPSCWDGESSDSDDHQSHVSYPTGGNTGKCDDKAHPYRLQTIFMISGWNTKPFTTDELWHDGLNGEGHPFAVSNGDTTGFGWHGDFVNGWKKGTLQAAIDKKCTSIDGCAGVLSRIDPEVKSRCAVAPKYDTGDRGVLDKLPGENALANEGAAPSPSPGDDEDGAPDSPPAATPGVFLPTFPAKPGEGDAEDEAREDHDGAVTTSKPGRSSKEIVTVTMTQTVEPTNRVPDDNAGDGGGDRDDGDDRGNGVDGVPTPTGFMKKVRSPRANEVLHGRDRFIRGRRIATD